MQLFCGVIWERDVVGVHKIDPSLLRGDPYRHLGYGRRHPAEMVFHVADGNPVFPREGKERLIGDWARNDQGQQKIFVYGKTGGKINFCPRRGEIDPLVVKIDGRRGRGPAVDGDDVAGHQHVAVLLAVGQDD